MYLLIFEQVIKFYFFLFFKELASKAKIKLTADLLQMKEIVLNEIVNKIRLLDNKLFLDCLVVFFKEILKVELANRLIVGRSKFTLLIL